jgi:hypothetical protein
LKYISFFSTVPLTYATLLYEYRTMLNNHQVMDREATTNYAIVGHLRFLVEAYEPKYYWFEVAECFRRLLLASVIGVFPSDSAVSAVLGLLVAMLFIYVFVAFSPYKERDDNILGVLLAYSLALLFLAALMIKADVTTDDDYDQDSFGAVLVLVLFAGPTIITGFVMYAYAERMVDVAKGICFNCFPGSTASHHEKSIELEDVSSMEANEKKETINLSINAAPNTTSCSTDTEDGFELIAINTELHGTRMLSQLSVPTTTLNAQLKEDATPGNLI